MYRITIPHLDYEFDISSDTVPDINEFIQGLSAALWEFEYDISLRNSEPINYNYLVVTDLQTNTQLDIHPSIVYIPNTNTFNPIIVGGVNNPSYYDIGLPTYDEIQRSDGWYTYLYRINTNIDNYSPPQSSLLNRFISRRLTFKYTLMIKTPTAYDIFNFNTLSFLRGVLTVVRWYTEIPGYLDYVDTFPIRSGSLSPDINRAQYGNSLNLILPYFYDGSQRLDIIS